MDKVAELLEEILADDYVSVFTKDGNTTRISKQEFIYLITKEN